jgi:uncharacterized protein (TIGR03437 family)
MGILVKQVDACTAKSLFLSGARPFAVRQSGSFATGADHKKRGSTLREVEGKARCTALFLLAAVLFGDTPTFVVATAAGLVPGASSIAIQQHLVQPVVVAYDPNGTLYYGTYHQVWRLNPDGTDTLIAGNGSNDPTHPGDGGPAPAASLCWISGLAIDAQHNIYISDSGPFEIRKVTPSGSIERFAGTDALPSYGTPSNAGAGVIALKVPLNPGALAIDSVNLYVTDSATYSVLAFTLDGSSSKVIAGNHGNLTAGDGGLASNASLRYPGTLALANGSLFVNEAGGARIRQVSFRSSIISTLVQLTQSSLSDNGNEGMAADTDGSIYVQQGNTIDRIYANTTTPLPYAGGGVSNPGDPGPASQVTLLAPKSLAVNPVSHDLALADYNSDLIETVGFDTGAIQAVAGTVHFAGDNEPAALAIFNGLETVAADSQGNLYLADVGNNRIRKIDTNGIITTVAGNGTTGFSGDGGPATTAALNLKHVPTFSNNLTVDAAGNLYISDYGNGRIRKVDATGIITTVAGGGAAHVVPGVSATSAAILPGPLAVDSSGNIYFGQAVTGLSVTIPTIFKIDSTGRLSTFAGGSFTKGADSGPAASTPVGNAACLVADSLDNFYICDAAGNRLREVTPNGMMLTIAGAATAMASPTAAAIDPAGDIFIGAAGQVLEIDLTGAIRTIATFNSIAGMAADSTGNLYLSDSGVYLREAMLVGSNGIPPIISSGGVVGAGGSTPPVRDVSPGAMVSIFGANFSPAGTQRMVEASDINLGHLPTNLAGVCVTFGGVGASIAGVFPNQLNVLVPALPPGAATVQVTSNCGSSRAVSGNRSGIAVNGVSPEFFTDVTSNNTIPAAGINGPVAPGGIAEVYGTGWGATNPAIVPGMVPGGTAQLASMPSLTLGSEAIPPQNILYAGLSPCCAGIYQVDFTLPDDVLPGNLPLIITVNGISSPSNAYLVVGSR